MTSTGFSECLVHRKSPEAVMMTSLSCSLSVQVCAPSRCFMFIDDFSSSLKSFSYLQINYLLSPIHTPQALTVGTSLLLNATCLPCTGQWWSNDGGRDWRGVDRSVPVEPCLIGRIRFPHTAPAGACWRAFTPARCVWESTQVEDSTLESLGSYLGSKGPCWARAQIPEVKGGSDK